jgi:UDP-N-acetylglucosamine--N-acetylmuramyl-(pentapeptide) pyrophosphoryl-undecaprenol N-acetylglucosamine transferase
MKPCIVVTGGGTGGHVFPALAVVEELTRRGDFRFVWIGGTTGVERQIVRRWGMEFRGIPTGKLRRYLSLENLRDVFRTLAGVFRSIAILRELKPVAVFSKGGFVSVPPVLAAGLLGIPVISHESDYDPGLATRLNRRWTRLMLVAYDDSLRFFRRSRGFRGRALATGNPVRAEILAGKAAEGRRIAGFGDHDPRPVLLVVGGSLGARQLNQLVDDSFEELLAEYRVIHQRGAGDWSRQDVPGAYFSRPGFAGEFPHLLAAADVVLSRAGASGVWEMGVLGKPGVLVPLGAGSRGDQIRNAGHCAKSGAVVVFRPEEYAEPQLATLDFRETMHELAVDRARRARMSAAWNQVVWPDGAARSARAIEALLAARSARR